jgi:hypothetical protein
MSTVTAPWQPIGAVSKDRLLNARLQAHCAAHIAGAPARILAAPEPDFGHVSMAWNPEARVLQTRELAGSFICGLNIANLEIHAGGEKLTLDGKTLGETRDWVASQVEAALGKAPGEPIPEPNEWPDHPVSAGGTFDASDTEAFAELERHFSNAALTLAPYAENEPHASPVRTWPHHFDMATLISLDLDKDPEVARSVNAGLSPGDDKVPEPYWYVVPYPSPKKTGVEALPRTGYWNFKGGTMAILRASGYAHTGAAQQAHVGDFLEAAYRICRSLLED